MVTHPNINRVQHIVTLFMRQMMLPLCQSDSITVDNLQNLPVEPDQFCRYLKTKPFLKPGFNLGMRWITSWLRPLCCKSTVTNAIWNSPFKTMSHIKDESTDTIPHGSDLRRLHSVDTAHAVPHASYMLYCAVQSPPSKKFAHSCLGLPTHTTKRIILQPTRPTTSNDITGVHTLNIYCYYLCKINWPKVIISQGVHRRMQNMRHTMLNFPTY